MELFIYNIMHFYYKQKRTFILVFRNAVALSQ